MRPRTHARPFKRAGGFSRLGVVALVVAGAVVGTGVITASPGYASGSRLVDAGGVVGSGAGRLAGVGGAVGSGGVVGSGAGRLVDAGGVVGSRGVVGSGRGRLPGVGATAGSTTIGDRAWLDSDRDGIQDAGEQGIEGVVCMLRSPDGVAVDTATTDASGAYHFDDVAVDSSFTIACDDSAASNLPDGVTPAALSVTVKGAGGSADLDSNAAPDQTMLVLTGDAGNNDASFDIGYTVPAGPPSPPVPPSSPPVPPSGPPSPPASGPPSPPAHGVSIGDHVFFDVDGDGIQSAADTPISGVIATVMDETNHEVGTATTDPSGNYVVSGLTPSTSYTICFDVTGATGLPAGVTPVQLIEALQSQGEDPGADSDIDATDCAWFTSQQAGEDSSMDAGFIVKPPPPAIPAP
jgi:hypothetical protein